MVADLSEILHGEYWRNQPWKDRAAALRRDVPKTIISLLEQNAADSRETENGYADPILEKVGPRKALVSRLLYETGGESLAVACKAAGFDSRGCATISGYTRHGRPAADPIDTGNHDIIEFYDGTEQTVAEAALERWRRGAVYLYAINLLDQAG